MSDLNALAAARANHRAWSTGDLDMTLPMGDVRIVEHFTVNAGAITRVRQIHHAAAVRAARFGRKL